jgi:iron complex transport system permease protein
MRVIAPPRALLAGLLLTVGVLALSLAIGSDGFSPRAAWHALAAGRETLYADVVLDLRLPRVLTAFACGGLLALAGALMQVLLRNPLADPYVLGLAGGAGVGALSAMSLGAGAVSALAGAWAGALASVALVLWFGRALFRARPAPDPEGHPLRLLLIGVALASTWAAAITLILAFAPEASVKGLLFWLMGDLDAGSYSPAPLAGLALACALGLLLARSLNVLALGAEAAQSLGVAVGRTGLQVMLLASAATALAVTTAGTLGFIGLLVPNGVRRLIGNDQRWLLPISALAGGSLLAAADALARSLIAPMQLPVGAVIAMLGAPGFIVLVTRARPGA